MRVWLHCMDNCPRDQAWSSLRRNPIVFSHKCKPRPARCLPALVSMVFCLMSIMLILRKYQESYKVSVYVILLLPCNLADRYQWACALLTQASRSEKRQQLQSFPLLRHSVLPAVGRSGTSGREKFLSAGQAGRMDLFRASDNMILFKLSRSQPLF